MRGKNVFKFARATMTLLFAMLTNFGAWAESDNVASLSEDNDFAQGAAGHYYVKIGSDTFQCQHHYIQCV